MEKYDLVIIGAGIYGLYASLNKRFSKKTILIIEKESNMLTKASYINQARLHNGYHYPRSFFTAKTSAKYFNKFYNEHKFAINDRFTSIYAISKENSYVTKEEFENFCKEVEIPLKEINSDKYFNKGVVTGVYETKEYVYDINLIRKHYKEKIKHHGNINIAYNTYIKSAEIEDSKYLLTLNDDKLIETNCVINTTYASINQINTMFNIPEYEIKYEICEVELGRVNEALTNTAITVMDGPFFSIMPFGNTDFYSLTSVSHTPHATCYKNLPEFDCQKYNKQCSSTQLENCNECDNRPKTKEKEMLKLYNTYIKSDYKFNYENSLFAIKPILLNSETDDSRPTIVIKHRENPTFISCLSGKFNTIYVLDKFIQENFYDE